MDYVDRFVTVAGIQMRYLDEGSGAPLLLLHGGGPAASGVAHYSRNIGPLSARFRVLAPDLPNFGRSGPAMYAEANSVFNARMADAFLGAIGVERASVAGYSMGGSAAITLAARYPARVDRVVLLGAGGTSLPSLFVPSPSEGARGLAAFMRNPTRAAFEEAYALFVYDPACYEPGLIDRLWADFEATPAAPAVPARPRDNLVPDLALIQAETLVVKGRDDRLAPLDQGLAALWTVPNARLHVFSHCGHWMQYEKAVELNRLMIDFLSA